MALTFLRRRRLGRTSVNGIIDKMVSPAKHVRSWITRDMERLDSEDWVVRWGCTANIPGDRVINTASAIHQVNDKAHFRSILQEKELCPDTWFNGVPPSYPCIVRPSRHAQGRNLHVCYTQDEYGYWTNYYSRQGRRWYASKLISKEAEYRVAVVSGRVAWVAKKTPADPDAVAWNVAQGGRFDNVNWDAWPLRVVRVAVEAFNLTDLDFGGVDVMVGKDGQAYVIEINSAPSLTSDYRQSCMAKCFDYMIENGKERIPLIEERGGYRKFIHPAVCDRARMVEDVSPEIDERITFVTDMIAKLEVELSYYRNELEELNYDYNR